jgi:general L-amino acid transport system substrate-binding protein
MTRTHARIAAPVITLALVVAGCGDDDDGGDGTAAPDDTSETTDSGVAIGGTTTPDTGDEVQTGDSVLDQVIANDEVKCGTRDDLPGFATVDAEGEHVGFDADFCRAIAAAVLGDATKVNFVDVSTDDRFTALQSGEIDVLVRNTTYTAGRDGGEGATFLQPTFYDGQGMMVAADSGFETLADMDGVVVCVAQGTTTEGNAAAEAQTLGVEWEVRPFEDVDLLQEAFVAGQCDGWSSDTSQLTGLRSAYPDGPDSLVILDEVFSKEPLAPAVADGDTQWAQAVNWAIYATIQAEEFGITSENMGEFESSEDPNIQRFLGLEVAAEEGEAPAVLDPGLGLAPDFAANAVSQVGNYGEIFDEHLAPLGLERGVNALWTDGGLMYAPPYR